MKTKLTVEQSQRLIGLGVPKGKASDIEEYSDELSQWIHRGAPIFTLDDFLNGEILPKELMLDKEHGLDFGWDFYENKWFARYSDEDSICVYKNTWYSDEELINTLYQLACWYYGEYLKSEKK